LSGYAQNIGLAFQIVDDILDITATQELGKTAGKDLQAKSDLSAFGVENPSVKQQLIILAAAAETNSFGRRKRGAAALADFITSLTNHTTTADCFLT